METSRKIAIICHVCSLEFSNDQHYSIHLGGRLHKENFEATSKNALIVDDKSKTELTKSMNQLKKSSMPLNKRELLLNLLNNQLALGKKIFEKDKKSFNYEEKSETHNLLSNNKNGLDNDNQSMSNRKNSNNVNHNYKLNEGSLYKDRKLFDKIPNSSIYTDCDDKLKKNSVYNIHDQPNKFRKDLVMMDSNLNKNLNTYVMLNQVINEHKKMKLKEKDAKFIKKLNNSSLKSDYHNDGIIGEYIEKPTIIRNKSRSRSNSYDSQHFRNKTRSQSKSKNHSLRYSTNNKSRSRLNSYGSSGSAHETVSKTNMKSHQSSFSGNKTMFRFNPQTKESLYIHNKSRSRSKSGKNRSKMNTRHLIEHRTEFKEFRPIKNEQKRNLNRNDKWNDITKNKELDNKLHIFADEKVHNFVLNNEARDNSRLSYEHNLKNFLDRNKPTTSLNIQEVLTNPTLMKEMQDLSYTQMLDVFRKLIYDMFNSIFVKGDLNTLSIQSILAMVYMKKTDLVTYEDFLIKLLSPEKTKKIKNLVFVLSSMDSQILENLHLSDQTNETYNSNNNMKNFSFININNNNLNNNNYIFDKQEYFNNNKFNL